MDVARARRGMTGEPNVPAPGERFAAMMLEPFAYFDDPREVAETDALSLTEKVSILKIMESELAEVPTSANDSTRGDAREAQAEMVRETLHRLRAAEGFID